MNVYVGLSSHLHEPFLYNSFSLHFTYFALPPQSLIEFFAVAFFKMNRVYSRPSKDSLAIYLLLYIFILISFSFQFHFTFIDTSVLYMPRLMCASSLLSLSENFLIYMVYIYILHYICIAIVDKRFGYLG